MKQRMSKKKHRQVKEATGLKVFSLWHRGGRTPRYWDVFVERHNLDGGWFYGYWYPEAGEFVREMGAAFGDINYKDIKEVKR